jgi:hypothetical protein
MEAIFDGFLSDMPPGFLNSLDCISRVSECSSCRHIILNYFEYMLKFLSNPQCKTTNLAIFEEIYVIYVHVFMT